ncbi:MAG: type II toxin-antitoxin system VapC family toxin [Bacteroidia bacterium]
MRVDRVFWDTNVLIDLLADRDPYYVDAALIASQADQGKIELYASTLSFANCAYVLGRVEKDEKMRNKLTMIKTVIRPVSLDVTSMEKALSGGFPDFEDALQYYCALQAECSIILTRNGRDFRESAIAVMSPAEYLASLKA